MLDSCCFNAKYATYLCDYYDKFPWSLSFLLNWLFWLLPNVIIVWFVMTNSLSFSGRTLAIFGDFLPGILPLYSNLSPTVTTSHCGCWLLSEFSICNAKRLCYFQFLVTGFYGHMPYPLTWALLLYIQESLPFPLTRVYNVSLSLFTWALYNIPVLFTWTFNKLSFSLCNVFTLWLSCMRYSGETFIGFTP